MTTLVALAIVALAIVAVAVAIVRLNLATRAYHARCDARHDVRAHRLVVFCRNEPFDFRDGCGILVCETDGHARILGMTVWAPTAFDHATLSADTLAK